MGGDGADMAGTVGMPSAAGGELLGAGAAGGNGSLVAHATSNNGAAQRLMNRHKHAMGLRTKITVSAELGNKNMLLILLEALGAVLILVLIVWWTMFSGRRKGERDDQE